jgi:hypothetical protein
MSIWDLSAQNLLMLKEKLTHVSVHHQLNRQRFLQDSQRRRMTNYHWAKAPPGRVRLLRKTLSGLSDGRKISCGWIASPTAEKSHKTIEHCIRSQFLTLIPHGRRG